MAFQDYSLIQAPMAGGLSTADVVAGASRAGALGSVGAGYLSGDAIMAAADGVRAAGGDAFAVNLFIPAQRDATDPEWRAALKALAPCYRQAGVPVPDHFPPLPDFREQFEAMLEARPAVFSWTFGRLPKSMMAACRARGITLVGTATNRDEALALAGDGVDGIVLQGEEAGGHRGGVDPLGEGLPLAALLDACRDLETPLIAAGGHHPRHVGAVHQATGQLGTAFLRCPEAGTAEGWRQALADAGPDATAVTWAVSGRWARGVANAWMDGRAPTEVAPYPDQHRLTSPLRKAAGAEWKSLWAGTGAHRSRALPVAELVQVIEDERRAHTP